MHSSTTAPLALRTLPIDPEWIDYNGHMNVAYYVRAFDLGIDVLYESLGLGEAYLKTCNCSTFTLELHVNYISEVGLDDPIELHGRILDYDHKRMHLYMEMLHGGDGHLVATLEQIGMHIDMTRRRSAPFPDDLLQRISAIHEQYQSCPQPENRGSVIAIPRKITR